MPHILIFRLEWCRDWERRVLVSVLSHHLCINTSIIVLPCQVCVEMVPANTSSHDINLLNKRCHGVSLIWTTTLTARLTTRWVRCIPVRCTPSTHSYPLHHSRLLIYGILISEFWHYPHYPSLPSSTSSLSESLPLSYSLSAATARERLLGTPRGTSEIYGPLTSSDIEGQFLPDEVDSEDDEDERDEEVSLALIPSHPPYQSICNMTWLSLHCIGWSVVHDNHLVNHFHILLSSTSCLSFHALGEFDLDAWWGRFLVTTQSQS